MSRFDDRKRFNSLSPPGPDRLCVVHEIILLVRRASREFNVCIRAHTYPSIRMILDFNRLPFLLQHIFRYNDNCVSPRRGMRWLVDRITLSSFSAVRKR